MSEFTRKFIDSLMPEGTAWFPAANGDFFKFLEGEATNIDDVKAFLEKLAFIRDPLRTPLLDELEIEFGVTKNENLTEDQRRQYLNSLIFTQRDNGTPEDLERRLQDAGFPVQIHTNDPATDPNIFVDQVFRMFAQGPTAYAGRQDAFARRIGGELIVNGDQFRQIPVYTSVANSATAFAGNAAFVAGLSEGSTFEVIEYNVPTDPNSWPFVFFIGGDATRDMDGKLTSIERVAISNNVKNEFLQIILKYKPLYTWGVSLVDFL